MILLLTLVTLISGLPNFYHTSHQLEAEVDKALQHCHHATKHHHQRSGIFTIHMNKSHKKKALLIFGEHPRELITAEVGLHLLKDLCKNPPNMNVMLILNMNPKSRSYVEKGHYCLRENQNGVDLNRNYDFHWQHKIDHNLQDSSGEQPFSEPETQLVRNLLEELEPELFISIHSGALALLSPWAYRKEDAETTQSLEKLTEIKNKHCKNCLTGGAASTIGYTAKGSSMDYAKGVTNVDNVYTFEIYSYVLGLMKEPESNFQEFLEHKEKMTVGLKELDCFRYFNPSTQSKYDHTVKKWSAILREMLE